MDMNISVVIPGRNEEDVIGACLDSVVTLLVRKEVGEVIFVDDGSVDLTADVVNRYPVQYIKGSGRGPGATRNLGWRKAVGEYIWFLDADCVAEPGSLARLMAHFTRSDLAGAGGSFTNADPAGFLGKIIYEEISIRHRRMKPQAGHLASGHVVFRRDILERLGGFNEQFITAEDAELSYRISSHGYRLVFDRDSKVGHHYPNRLAPYLQAQAIHAYWRTHLYYLYRHMAKGDAYSGIIDFIQPIMALALLACWPYYQAALVLAGGMILLQLPMAGKMMAGHTTLALAFIPLGVFRALVHGVGMLMGVISLAGRWFRSISRRIITL